MQRFRQCGKVRAKTESCTLTFSLPIATVESQNKIENGIDFRTVALMDSDFDSHSVSDADSHFESNLVKS